MKFFDKIIYWTNCSVHEKKKILSRPDTFFIEENIQRTVNKIIENIKNKDDTALYHYNFVFDKCKIENLKLSEKKIQIKKQNINTNLKKSINFAIENIKKFHIAQELKIIDIETIQGVRCQQIYRPIETVGIYIPGGSAPLFSTVLMLGIPAKLAGCKRIILCSPPPIADEIIYAADICGIKEIFQIGGAQAIAAMGLGTKSVPKVNKIFGPGNNWVTEAKRQISSMKDGTCIDMLAGPSELVIIADESADTKFIASDLLSQAEHSPDAQVLLLTYSENIAKKVAIQIEKQLTVLNRTDIIFQSLSKKFLIVTKNIEQCIYISNKYAPEHLIIHTEHPRTVLEKIKNAGSVFIGPWSPESAGDYASGANHVLPTSGYAKSCSGLGLIDFKKRITVQECTSEGLINLAPIIETLSTAEKLFAHKNAVTLRMQKLKVLKIKKGKV